jgi:hypothetical protein
LISIRQFVARQTGPLLLEFATAVASLCSDKLTPVKHF